MRRKQRGQSELGRTEVLARVRSQQLRVVDAARLMRATYRPAKRLWKRYREEGAVGPRHRSAGRPSRRAYQGKFLREGAAVGTREVWGNTTGGLCEWRRNRRTITVARHGRGIRPDLRLESERTVSEDWVVR